MCIDEHFCEMQAHACNKYIGVHNHDFHFNEKEITKLLLFLKNVKKYFYKKKFQ